MAVATTSSDVFIAGEWHRCPTQHLVSNPYTGEVCGSCGLADAALLERALASAERGFAETRRVPAFRRAELLLALRDGVGARSDEIVGSIVAEAGKPIKDARTEVARAMSVLSLCAEEAKRIGGDVVPLDMDPASVGRWGITRKMPVGPVLAITPFNFPLNLGLHKIGPALAAGNSIVWKPSLLTPTAAYLFATIFADACEKVGFSVDALSVVTCGDDMAGILVEDRRIRMVSFTGSDRVGWALRGRAGSAKVALELGGNAAVIVGPDADIAHVAKRCADGGFNYAGQRCNSVQRILVARSAYESFLGALLAEVGNIRVGDPSADSTGMGPVIREREAERILGWLDDAVADGATLVAGGGRSRLLIEPTVAVNVPRDSALWSSEVFGPVVVVALFDDWDEALCLANDTRYGLVAGVFTQDIGRIMQAYESLEVGAVMVNDVPTYRSDGMPYGGVKESGLGREGVRYAIEEMTDARFLAFC